MARSKNTLTPAQVEAYAKNPGHCPFCGSDDISGGQVDIDSDAAHQEVSCLACEADWIDEYRLSCIIIDDPEKHTSKDYDLRPVKVGVFISGGVVQEVRSNMDGVKVEIMDGDEQEETMDSKQRDDAYEAFKKRYQY